MKATGIVRPLDSLGRVVLPIELRRTLLIGSKDELEIYTEEDTIILKKYVEKCILCGESKSTIQFKGKLICRECIDYIKL